MHCATCSIRGLGSKPACRKSDIDRCKLLILPQIQFLTYIADSYMLIAICYMTLRDKLRYLREVEGSLRGLDRPLTQAEVVRALNAEHRKGISQAYLSQIESGKRPHMTNDTRALLAKFFKVHPGFLVDDPEGFHTELTSDLRTTEGRLDIWLLQGAEHFRTDHDVAEVMVKMARHPDTRSCFILTGAILDTPGLAERLLEALGPEKSAKPMPKSRGASGRRRSR